MNRENELGAIEKNKLADLIVLDRDLYSASPEDIKDTNVLLTMVDGKVVYQV